MGKQKIKPKYDNWRHISRRTPTKHRRCSNSWDSYIERFGPYHKAKCLCVTCRKVWRAHSYGPWGRPTSVCPQCGGRLLSVGPDYRTPRRNDKWAWTRLQERLQAREQRRGYNLDGSPYVAPPRDYYERRERERLALAASEPVNGALGALE